MVSAFKDAVGRCQISIASILVKKGFNVTDKNIDSFLSALMTAETLSYFDEFFSLFLKNTDVSLFTQAIDKSKILLKLGDSDYKLFKALLKLGSNPNVKNKYGTTPLILAATPGRANIISLFLDANADIDAQDNTGSTALMYAASYGHLKAVEILLSEGADPNLQNNHGHTALELAKFNSKSHKSDKFKQILNLLDNKDNDLPVTSNKRFCNVS